MVKGGFSKADETEYKETWQTPWKTPYIMRLALSAGIGGLLFGYDRVYYNLYQTPETWRWMLGVASLPALLQFILMLSLLESPRWLYQNERVDEAREILERIYPAEEIEEEIRALEYSVQVKKEVESTIEETSMLGKVKKAWGNDVYVEVVPQMEKQRRLEKILRAQERGSKARDERDRVLNQFRTGKSPILVATDVAARGLDIRDIRVVVNHDFPTGVEDYVHRTTELEEREELGQPVPLEVRDMALRGGLNHFESVGGGRWDSSGCRGGARDGGFAGRGGN
ncbi:hypothetical protein RHGRI_003167 [Rhododendron griersonianum]|uniref:Helicase C-terminal domain-containing protein n=1 Tax=Rhododendron griersonianum TaxID=479676 RepID=A0AAV6L762_9ERIC|nr:hypothetical protein RHGRI_003167 [Rhododendron griersonianum]